MTKPDLSPDDRLAALFAAELPPARDVGFQTEVLAAVARRELMADLLLLATMTTLSALGLWGLWPVLAPVLEAVWRDFGPALTALVAAGSILAVTTGRVLAPRS